MGTEQVDQQQEHAGEAADGCQQLTDPEGSQVQTVGAQTFDQGSAQAIPGAIAQSDLAVILALFAE